MSNKEMKTLTLTVGSLLPSFSLVSAANDNQQHCHGQICHSVDEYCSSFTEGCLPCANTCDASSHNYDAQTCAKECSAYVRYEALKAEILNIQSTQHLVLLLLSILLILIAIRYLVKCLSWLKHKRCFQKLLPKLWSKPYQHSNVNGKDLNATTIQNFNAINRDIERAPSQIYSVAGAAEGSVVTMATPVSTRYPAENSTTPTTIVTEIGYGHGYDNQAMVVTPVTETPARSTAVF